MAISQQKVRRKPTGARYKDAFKKKYSDLGRDPTFTKLEPLRKKKIRVRGNNFKIRLWSTDVANVLDQKTKKHQVVKIKTVVGNPANRHFIRRNIITKGAILETELGKARVTSRPGQDGIVNAVLIS